MMIKPAMKRVSNPSSGATKTIAPTPTPPYIQNP